MSSFLKKLQNLVDTEEELKETEEEDSQENLSLGAPELETEKPIKKDLKKTEKKERKKTKKAKIEKIIEDRKETIPKEVESPTEISALLQQHPEQGIEIKEKTFLKENFSGTEKKESDSRPIFLEKEVPMGTQRPDLQLERQERKEKIKTKKWPEPEGQLVVDIYQTENDLIIQSAIAGVKPEDLDIDAQGDTLIIKGKRESPNKEKKNYFCQECYWGSFSKEIVLPVEADTSRSEATMVNGILTIKIPKIEKEKRNKIVIK